MSDDLMKVWIEKIWFKHTQAECKKLGFENSLPSLDVLAVNLTEEVKISFIRK